jgi:hypothetical protein
MSILKKYFYVLNGILAFIIYQFTLAPSVVQIDSGELATVQCVLGIAHPTGYPLFTIIGYLFSQIPLPISKILQLNILASLYCAAGISVFTYTTKFILDNISKLRLSKNIKEKKKRKNDKAKKDDLDNNEIVISENIKILVSIIAGLFLAISKTFWMQSTSVEVYSLHLLLINLIILSLFKAYINFDREKTLSKYWMFFAIALALGFTNHMTTLLIIPGVAYLYFNQNGFNKRSIKQIGLMLLIFFPVLILFYSYLPIRASQNPLLNWGNPIDLERIFRHITGKQYQVWLFSSTEAASKQFAYFVSNLSSEFFIASIFILIGIYVSFIEAKKLFVFLVITFLFTVLYSINYDINDIDSYFLLAYVSLGFWVSLGILKVFQFLTQRNVKIVFSSSLIVLFLGIEFINIYPEVNQKQNFVYKDYTETVLNSVPKNSIIFTYQWDYLVSPSYYFQYVEKFRNDVIVIDKELLRRSWYYHQLKINYPNLLSGIQSDVNNFLNALAPFERSENFNPNLLENLFRKIMTELISTNISNHDYFIAPEIVENEMRRGEFQIPKGYTLVPYLFLYKVVNSSDYINAPFPDFHVRFPEKKDKYVLALENIIGSMLLNRALYELRYNHIEMAKTYTKKIATEIKDFALPPELKKLVNN